MKKKRTDLPAIVYSTDPSFNPQPPEQTNHTLSPSEQVLRIVLETKHRAGKTVTVIFGFVGTDADLEQLGKKLKNHCGTGGSSKDGEIILQGDHREKVRSWLQKNQFGVK